VRAASICLNGFERGCMTVELLLQLYNRDYDCKLETEQSVSYVQHFCINFRTD